MPRTLFLTSPTPAGVADFREAQDAENTVYLPGVLGAVFLNEAMKLVQNTQTEIFLHPLTPEAPQCVRIGDTMLCAADDTRQKNGGEDIGEQKRGEAGHKASSDGAGTDARPRKRPAGAGHQGSA